VRVQLKGVKQVTKVLADGSTRTYWYAWVGGPRLEGKPNSPEFNASYQAAVSANLRRPTGTLQSILSQYQQSLAFTNLRSSTRVGYGQHIVRIERDFGDFPLVALSDPKSRDVFLKWRDKIGQTSPRSADFSWTVLKAILNWAKDRGLVTEHHCHRGGRLYDGDRSDNVWLPEDEANFLAKAPKRFHLPLLLGIYTGQREGDLLRLPGSSYDSEFIRLRQSKTNMNVTIPVATKLKVALAETPRVSPIMLVDSFGRPWKTNSFSRGFHEAAVKAGITGLTFHDTRGSCVTRLAIVGCTVPEIATITGHSLKDAARIIDKYLSRDVALARAAIAKLETRTSLETKQETGGKS